MEWSSTVSEGNLTDFKNGSITQFLVSVTSDLFNTHTHTQPSLCFKTTWWFWSVWILIGWQFEFKYWTQMFRDWIYQTSTCMFPWCTALRGWRIQWSIVPEVSEPVVRNLSSQVLYCILRLLFQPQWFWMKMFVLDWHGWWIIDLITFESQTVPLISGDRDGDQEIDRYQCLCLLCFPGASQRRSDCIREVPAGSGCRSESSGETWRTVISSTLQPTPPNRFHNSCFYFRPRRICSGRWRTSWRK